MGYHINTIPKGEFGEFSKIEEEYAELMDARQQSAKVLEIVELTDLLGAIEGYVAKTYNLTLEDLIKMSKLTQSAFKDGSR